MEQERSSAEAARKTEQERLAAEAARKAKHEKLAAEAARKVEQEDVAASKLETRLSQAKKTMEEEDRKIIQRIEATLLELNNLIE